MKKLIGTILLSLATSTTVLADGHALSEKNVVIVLADAGVTFRRMEQHPASFGNQENST